MFFFLCPEAQWRVSESELEEYSNHASLTEVTSEADVFDFLRAEEEVAALATDVDDGYDISALESVVTRSERDRPVTASTRAKKPKLKKMYVLLVTFVLRMQINTD